MSSRSVGSLLVNVGANTKPLTAGLAQATKQVRAFGSQVGSTARGAGSAFSSMGNATGQMLARMRGLPMVGGLLSAGGLAAAAGAAVGRSASQAMQYSPQAGLIQQRMQLHQMRQGMALGSRSPMASYLLSGGIFSVLGQLGSNLAAQSPLFDTGNPLGALLEHPGTILNLLDQTAFGDTRTQHFGPLAHEDSPIGQLWHTVSAELQKILKEISPYSETNRAQGVNP